MTVTFHCRRLRKMITRTNLTRSKLANIYWNMWNRCYLESYLEKNPKYRGCTICDDWLNDRESFYDWIAENYYIIEDEQIDLDKDILVKGNRIYSPDTCIFTPHVINTYFEKITRSPQKTNNGKYSMEITVNGKRINLGTFDTEEEAKLEYIKHKQAAILAKADEYKGRIPKKLYDAMVNYQIDLSDWDKEKAA